MLIIAESKITGTMTAIVPDVPAVPPSICLPEIWYGFIRDFPMIQPGCQQRSMLFTMPMTGKQTSLVWDMAGVPRTISWYTHGIPLTEAYRQEAITSGRMKTEPDIISRKTHPESMRMSPAWNWNLPRQEAALKSIASKIKMVIEVTLILRGV